MTNVVPKEHIKKTPVTEMLNFNESIRKEKTHFKIYENFTINPAKLMVYPEKPNLLKPLSNSEVSSATLTASPGLRESTIDLDEETKSKLTRYSFVPKQKYAYPQTASQELGWFENNGQFSSTRKAKNACAETKYANDYYSMTHLSPYSKKNK